MDLSKIDISNVVTIIGMVAAFITASVTPIVTESVKNFFQHRTKLKQLKTALYKEMLNNFNLLRLYENATEESEIHLGIEVIQPNIRTECYKQTLERELILFYQLNESIYINLLYSRLTPIVSLVNRGEFAEPPMLLPLRCKHYLEGMSDYVYRGKFDDELVSTLMNKKDFQYLLMKGEKVSKKD